MVVTTSSSMKVKPLARCTPTLGTVQHVAVALDSAVDVDVSHTSLVDSTVTVTGLN